MTAGLRLELQWSDDTQWRRAIEPSELSGLADRDRTSPASVPVAFRMAQDAGTFEFEGTFRAGRGAGSFRFRPDRDFAATLRSLGVDSARDVSDHQLKNLAFGGISAAAVREVQALGFAPLTLSQLLDLAVFHVTPDYVRAMRAAGVRETKTVDQVVDLRFHDLTPAFVRCVRDAGYRDAAPDALLEMRRRGAPAC